MCGLCNCCLLSVPNDSTGATACCYKSLLLFSDPHLWNSGEILPYGVSVLTDNAVSLVARPSPALPPSETSSMLLMHLAGSSGLFYLSWMPIAAVCFLFFYLLFFPQRLLTRSIPSAAPDARKQVKMIRQCFHSISNENLKRGVSNCVSDCSVWLGYFPYRDVPEEFRSHHHKNKHTFYFSIAF